MSGMIPRSPSAGPPPPISGIRQHQQHNSRSSSSSHHHHRSGGSSSSHRTGGGSSSRDTHHRSSSRNSSNPSSSHHDDKRKSRSSSSKSSSSKHRSSGSNSKHDSRQRSKTSSSNSVKAPPLFKIVEHPLKELAKSSFLCNLKFQTGLPEINLDPVLLEYPKDFTENFIGYKTTSLEKNHKFELLTENNLGINLNLINPFVYYNDENAKLDPEDELLLKPVKKGKKELATELTENLSSRPSWLKAPTYVDMINYKKAVKSYGEDLTQDQVDEEITQKIKPKTVPRKVEEKNRFEKAKQLDAKFQSETLFKTLPNGKKVKAIACYSLLPDFSTIGTKFMAANFGSDNSSLLGKRGRFGELTAKDASDSLILIQPTDDIILAEKAGDDRNIQVAQYYVPVSNNDEDTLFNSEKSVGNVVELVREYGGTIYEKNSSNVQVNKENEKRFKLPNHLMSKDKMTQAEIEPCVALRFDDNTNQCLYTYIQEGVNFKVLPKKKKRRVFTKVKLTGTNSDEDVQFEDLASIMARTEDLGTKQDTTNDEEMVNEQPQQQQSDEEEEMILPSDRGSAKKRAVQSDDEDENMEESAPTGGEENMPNSPTGADQRAPSSEDEFDEE